MKDNTVIRVCAMTIIFEQSVRDGRFPDYFNRYGMSVRSEAGNTDAV